VVNIRLPVVPIILAIIAPACPPGFLAECVWVDGREISLGGPQAGLAAFVLGLKVRTVVAPNITAGHTDRAAGVLEGADLVDVVRMGEGRLVIVTTTAESAAPAVRLGEAEFPPVMFLAFAVIKVSAGPDLLIRALPPAVLAGEGGLKVGIVIGGVEKGDQGIPGCPVGLDRLLYLLTRTRWQCAG
jgi:hypothetical protein